MWLKFIPSITPEIFCGLSDSVLFPYENLKSTFIEFHIFCSLSKLFETKGVKNILGLRGKTNRKLEKIS